MKMAIVIIALLLIFFGIVYTFTKGSPQPTRADIEVALDNNLKYTPIRWNYKFGKETKASNGTPAWPVIYEITTSAAGINEKTVTLTLLFYQKGYEWKTEKVE